MATYVYDDFRVTFGAGGGVEGYPVSATDQAGVEVRGTFRMPFADSSLERVVLDLSRGATRKAAAPAPAGEPMPIEGIIAAGAASPAGHMVMRDVNGPATPIEQEAADIGDQLCRALLSGAIGEAYDAAVRRCRSAGRGLRLTLSLAAAPELLSVPWEFLYRRPQFFASQRHTPLVRHLDTGSVPSPPAIGAQVRILGVVASPGTLAPLDVAAERARIETALATVAGLGRVQVDWLEPATPRSLRTALRDGDYHVLHYVGHSDFTDVGEGVLFLEGPDGNAVQLDGTALANLLADQRHLRLVVLNSCEGARTTVSDPFAGVATTLVSLGVPAVVAMQFEISDAAAILFAEELYTNLIGRQDPIDAAVAEARKAIYIEQHSLEFATPVLFLADVDVPLFQFEVEAAPLPPPPPPGIGTPEPTVDGAAAGRRRRIPSWLPWVAAAATAVVAAALIWSWRGDAPVPVGDWGQGLNYNFGVVTGETVVEGHRAIRFDQVQLASDEWSGFRDAMLFDAEPVVAWWPAQRVQNLNPRQRTFVLAPDAEMLTLSTNREAEACAVAAGSVPPTWERVDDLSSGVGDYSSLTFSDSGLVERIRFTHPCPR